MGKNYWDKITNLKNSQTGKGLKKYGMILEDNVELTLFERINHLQEELVDALMYCEHLKEQFNKKFKIINKSNNPLPEYATCGASGLDIRADLDEPLSLIPGKVVKVPTGLYIELMEGYEAQIRSRSGMALKGITLANGIGTIDSDYRGEIGILLLNTTDQPFLIENGARIAQMVICRYEKIQWQEVDQLTHSQRGSGGYGSTGSN